MINVIRANVLGFDLSGAVFASIARVSLLCNKGSFSFVKRYENFVAHFLTKIFSIVSL